MYVIKNLFFVLIFLTIFYKKKINFIVPTEFNLENFNLYQSEKVFIQNDNEWSLSIPKLNLKNIPIKDNVESDILENYIGHFPISSYLQGNVCLAAHNGGYLNNYFSNIHMLQKGDEIYYYYFNIEKEYIVKDIFIIDENDFSCLNVDDEDKLTLITCISNSPQKRLCVQAVNKE